MFYGVNGHYDYSESIAQQIADLKTMGFTSYRVAYEGNSTSLSYLQNLATALKGTGITPIVCIDSSMCDGNGNLYPTEAAAYAAGYAYAQPVAAALVPLGVTIFECGNELDTKNNILTIPGVLGGLAADFNCANFPSLRGVLTGVYQAVRDVGGPSVQIASNAFTAGDIACADMLWDGKQPDGTSGHTPVRWDITNWHNYQIYGDPISGAMALDYQKPTFNLCDHLTAKYGKPIIFTEWNGSAGDTDAQRAAWATQFMTEAQYYAKIGLFPIQAICCYQLYNGSPYGVMNGPGQVEATFGTTVQSFIAANPM